MDGTEEATRPPGCLAGTGEHLLVGILRHMAAAAPCPVVARRLTEAFGEDAGEVSATLGAFLRALAYAGRRRLSVGHPGSIVLTRDEVQLLALLAAAQAAEPAWLDAHLCWLAKSDRREPLALAALALGTALAAHGYRFSGAPPPRPAIGFTAVRPESAARLR